MGERHVIATDAAPAAIGPYSQAIRHGDLVFCSGQIAIDPATSALVEGDVVAQTERVMQNLSAVLEAAGSSLSKVIKATIFLKDMGEFGRVNEAYGKYFSGDAPPARETVEVARLPKDVAIEISVIAAI